MNRLLNFAIAFFALQVQDTQAQEPNALADALSKLNLDKTDQKLCSELFLSVYQPQICAKQKDVGEQMVSKYGERAVRPTGTDFCDKAKVDAKAKNAQEKMSAATLATCKAGLSLFAEAHPDGDISKAIYTKVRPHNGL